MLPLTIIFSFVIFISIIGILFYYFHLGRLLIIGIPFGLFLCFSYLMSIIREYKKEDIIKRINSIKNKEELIFNFKYIQNKYIKTKTTENCIFLEKINDILVCTLLLNHNKKEKYDDLDKIIVKIKYIQEYENNVFPIFDASNIYKTTNEETETEKIVRALKIFIYEISKYFQDIHNPMIKLDKLNMNTNLDDLIGDTFIENYCDFIEEFVEEFLVLNKQKAKIERLIRINGSNKEINIEKLVDIISLNSTKVDIYLKDRENEVIIKE